MSQEDKVTQLSEYLDTSKGKERDSKDYSDYQEFKGIDWSEVFTDFMIEPKSTVEPSIDPESSYEIGGTEKQSLDSEEGIDMENFNRREFEEKMNRLEDKMIHQRDMDYQRYENLSSTLSTSISTSHDKLAASQESFFDKFELKNKNSLNEMKSENDKMITAFKEELRKERKSDRNTIIGWFIGIIAVAVTALSIIIPYLI